MLLSSISYPRLVGSGTLDQTEEIPEVATAPSHYLMDTCLLARLQASFDGAGLVKFTTSSQKGERESFSKGKKNTVIKKMKWVFINLSLGFSASTHLSEDISSLGIHPFFILSLRLDRFHLTPSTRDKAHNLDLSQFVHCIPIRDMFRTKIRVSEMQWVSGCDLPMSYSPCFLHGISN